MLDLDIVTDSAAQDGVSDHGITGFPRRYTARRSTPITVIRIVRVGGSTSCMSGATSQRLFAGVRELAGPGGQVMPVPRPEHLIAMKVQAIRDAPERAWQDGVDVGYLLRLPEVDRAEARGYFTRAGLEEKWRELERGL